MRFDAIGTRWEIETAAPLPEAARGRVMDRIERFDATWSRFRADSLVSRIASEPGGGTFVFPAEAAGLFDLYDRLAADTGGAVDPLVGRDLERLGYDATYSLVPRDGAPGPRLCWARDVRRGGRTVTVRRPVLIDVGAAGKGCLVDLVAETLRAAGIDEFVVEAGGDMRHAGSRGIRVGLEHPVDPEVVVGVVELRDRALCASAVNRRAWGDGLHHVVDARTGVPVRDVVATWVLAADAATADGLATALFFTDPHRLAETFDLTAARMLADGRVETSPDFDGELFTTNKEDTICPHG